MHVSSLPSNYGIGTLGQAAYDFVDDLKDAKQAAWQILPVCPTGYGDSPYASYSTFAGNPYFIDLDILAKDGLLQPEEFVDIDWSDSDDQVNYGKIYENRFDVLQKAVDRFLENPDAEYEEFLKENKNWLDDYALFMALKDVNDGKPWLEWDEKYRRYDAKKAEEWKKEFKDQVNFWEVVQYFFFKQWKELRKYANENGVEIIGDLPIYVALDSVDAWSHPELFLLDEDGKPTDVAGCPPDGFSEDGQLWGNPLYDWDYHKKTGYEWWINRIDHLTKLYDVLRIDHFRGFDSFYAIPYGSKNARIGEWRKGPGVDLFNVMEEKIGKKNIIAEDLGYLTDSVRQLLAETGFPGMKILEFGFDSRDGGGSEYLPYNYPKNSYAYAGTHDNDTINGWFETISEGDRKYAEDFLGAWDPMTRNWEMMKAVIASPSDTSIVQMQDVLNLDSSARMNTPGIAGGNWTWRMKKGAFSDEDKEKLAWLTKLYGRDVPAQKKALAGQQASEAEIKTTD